VAGTGADDDELDELEEEGGTGTRASACEAETSHERRMSTTLDKNKDDIRT
jgi:hypothetical protein